MKKRILLIALLGIFMGFCWSCSRDDEEEVPTSLDSFQEVPDFPGVEKANNN